MCALVFNFYLQAVTQSPEDEEWAVNAACKEGTQKFFFRRVYITSALFPLLARRVGIY